MSAWIGRRQDLEQVDTPTMLLGSRYTSAKRVNLPLPPASEIREKRPRTSRRITAAWIVPSKTSERERGVLGFDVFRQYATPSNVDVDIWKTADLPSHDRDPLMNSKGELWGASASGLRAPLNYVDYHPWMLTRSQIDSLKVVDLKQACMTRGLSKVRGTTS